MKSGSVRKASLSLAYFVVDLGAQMASVGAIVGSALSFAGVRRTAIIIALNAVACLLAILINRKLSKITLSRLLISGIWLSATVSFLLVVLKPMTAPWYVFLFPKLVMGFLLPAWFLTQLKEECGSNVIFWNKVFQILSSFGFLLALAAGPIIVSYLSIRGLFTFDAALLLLSAVIATRLFSFANGSTLPAEKLQADEPAAGGVNEFVNLIPTFAIVFTVFCLCGIFNVIEVPLLRARLNATAEQISFVFIAAGIGDLIGPIIIRAKHIENLNSSILACSALAVIGSGLAYAHVTHISIALIAVFIMGCANSVMFLSVAAVFHKIANVGKRAHAFMFNRLSMNIGLFCAALVASITNDIDRTILIFTAMCAAGVAFVVVLSILRHKALQSAKVGLATAVIVFSIVAPIGQSLGEDNVKSNKHVLSISVTELPSSLFPSEAISMNSATILRQLYDTLYSYSESDVLVPDLAESHLLADDGRLIRVRIRTNLTFSDGSPVSSKDVIRSLKETIYRLGPGSRWAFGDVEGYDSFVRARNPASNFSGIQATGPHELEFRLKRPFAQFLQVLTAPYFAVYKITSKTPSTLLGTGHYVIDNANSGMKQMLLKRRSDVSVDVNSPDEIRFILVKDADEADAMAQQGTIDIYEPKNVRQPAIDGFNVRDLNYLQNYLQAIIVIMNPARKQFARSDARCQFSRNMESAMKLDETYNLKAIALSLPFAHDLFPAAAKKVNSTTRANSAVPIQVLVSDSVAEFRDALNDRLAAALHVLGYNVKFVRRPFDDFIAKVRKGDFDAVMIGYIPDYLDADALLTPLLATGQQFNLNRYSNREIDGLLDIARTKSDAAERIGVYRQVMSLVGEECPLYYLGTQHAQLVARNTWRVPKLNSIGFSALKLKDVKWVASP